MRRVVLLVGLIGGCSVLLLTVCVSAGECDYGVASAWFCRPGADWENATTHPQLSRGEVFLVRVEVIATASLSVFFVKLHEFGTPVFEVLDGPTETEQLLECRQAISPFQRFSFTWTMRVRPETAWVRGFAPLELLVQFNTEDRAVCQVDFDVLTAYILEDEAGQGSAPLPPGMEPAAGGSLPGFVGGDVIIMMLLLVVLSKKR